MNIKQQRSKWLLVHDDGRIYKEFKCKKHAIDAYVEFRQILDRAYNKRVRSQEEILREVSIYIEG